MKKGFQYYVIVWAVLLAAFNIIVFITPGEAAGLSKFGGAFWPGYIFITLSFIGQLLCAFFAFKSRNAKKLFLNLPLITISYPALIVSVIVGTICMAVPNLQKWIGVLICFLIAAFYAIALIKAGAAGGIVSDIDENIGEKVFFIKSLLADVELILADSNSAPVKKKVAALVDVIKYSDPVSNAALRGIETDIEQKVAELAYAVNQGEDSHAEQLSDEIIRLFEQRNKKCKALK